MAYGDMMNGAIRRRRGAQPGAQAPTNFGDRESLVGAQAGAYGSAAGFGDQANASYYGRLQSFDPSAAVNQYAQGAWGSVSEGLNQTLARLKGESVGAGRFDSGFFDQDTGDVVRGTVRDFSNNLAQTAVQAAGMQQNNNEAIGRFGAQQQGIGNDLLMSRREELENNAREEEERKRKKRSGIGAAIGGILGGAGGFLLGGPVGAAGGFKAGSSIGGAF